MDGQVDSDYRETREHGVDHRQEAGPQTEMALLNHAIRIIPFPIIPPIGFSTPPQSPLGHFPEICAAGIRDRSGTEFLTSRANTRWVYIKLYFQDKPCSLAVRS